MAHWELVLVPGFVEFVLDSALVGRRETAVNNGIGARPISVADEWSYEADCAEFLVHKTPLILEVNI
jgi:hypothetical protein